MSYASRWSSRPSALALAVGLAAAASLPASAQTDPAGDALGTVHFEVECAAELQAEFDRALALLHHMMYVESRRAFGEIADRDPGCAMAHWGIAMTMFQPLWHPADPEALRKGAEAVRRARELGPATEPGRAILAATEAFYEDPESPDWWARLARWNEAMGEAHRSHPEHTEIAALYALSQLAAAQPAPDRVARNARAAELLLEVLEREPAHPGGVHYTIHANDVSGRADQSLEVVRTYDEIAPSVPHALHMPTHIFVRLGEWPAVIEWNRKSADAALRFPARDAVSLHYPHAMDYLLYAHLQRGEDERARAVLEEGTGKERYEADFASAFHLAAMPARWVVERRAWEEAAALEPRTPASVDWDRHPWPEAIGRFARGLGATRTGDLASARAAEARMRQLAARARDAGQSDHATYIEIDRRILAGWIAHAAGDAKAAEAEMRKALELERGIQKHPVTPGSLLPAAESLGDLLLEMGRPGEAFVAYETALETWPARYRSLLGAARAARDAGDDAAARDRYAALLEVAGDAEPPRPGVAEARKFLDEVGS